MTATPGSGAEPVEVEYAGTWYAAELRQRSRGPDGAERAHVALRRGTGTFLDTVPLSRVRRPSGAGAGSTACAGPRR